MIFKCQFPGCGYETDNKSQIHFHHINPRENKGNNKPYNLIQLCPNCHTKIFSPESKKGIHSIRNENSIILLGWKLSSSGKLLEYIDTNGRLQYK